MRRERMVWGDIKYGAVTALTLAALAIPIEKTATAAFYTPQLPAASCSTTELTAERPQGSTSLSLVEGLGYAGFEPDSESQEAREWFAQGVRLLWAFDEAEAVRAFQQALKLDPSCAMCSLGEAWARGPTINMRRRDNEFSAAKAAVARARQMAAGLNPRDTMLLRAMERRTQGAGFDNLGYASLLETASLRDPDDDLLAVMAADARMVAAPASSFKPGSLTQRLLERVMSRNPDHSGAIHYYIHLTDWTGEQQLAEPHADRLARLAPAASHLVHMPSHTYFGVGRYRDAAAANVAAIAADKAYDLRVRPPSSNMRTALLAHTKHFGIISALAFGDGRTALQLSEQFSREYLAGENLPPFIYLVGSGTFYSRGLHGNPQDALAAPEPTSGGGLAKSLHYYSRGEAFARLGDADGVRMQAREIDNILAALPSRGNSSSIILAEVMQHVLEGRAEMIAGNYEAAAVAYRKGMNRQVAGGFSSDPPPFWYSVQRSLGAALLASGDPLGARQQLLGSLQRWPNDPVALYALSQAETQLGWTGAAVRSLSQARSQWAGSSSFLPLARM